MTLSPRSLLLWVHTVRHLRISQIAHRARLRTQRSLYELVPLSTAPFARRRNGAPHGWPEDFVPLDLRDPRGKPDPEHNIRGSFEFLNELRNLGDPFDWSQPAAPLLWRYNLHYFEWAWSFAGERDRASASANFRSMWKSWKTATRFGRGDAWAPYVASLRTWVLCGVHRRLSADGPCDAEIAQTIAEHAGYVRMNLEWDVGGNHLIKNLKALTGAAVFLRDAELLHYAVDRVVAQMDVQVLDDGGHYERSPSYHCQVLGDLIDIRALLTAAGHKVPPAVCDAIVRMREWLGQMLMPDGDVPFFNDSARVGRSTIQALKPETVARSGPTVLAASGYVVAADDGQFIVIDAGPPCPPDLPAHAHSDCLSFELCIGTRRVAVNSGVSTYEPGPRRTYERSTRAHNTIEIDSEEQTETWGAFRAARRAGAVLERCRHDAAGMEIVGSHDGYSRLTGAPLHRRTWLITDGSIRIVDEVTGEGAHAVAAWLHFGDGDRVDTEPGSSRFRTSHVEVDVDGTNLDCEIIPPGREQEGWMALGFGDQRPAPALVARTSGMLPLRITTTIKTKNGMPTNYG
jgi:uncharacterized heparinase superfamily protein